MSTSSSTSSTGSDSSDDWIHFPSDEDRVALLINGLSQLWETKSLTDVTLVSTDGAKFPAHRAVLAAASRYFYVLFTTDMAERDMDIITLHGVHGEGLEVLLTYIYTGEMDGLYGDIVLDVLSGASLFQLDIAIPECVRCMVDTVCVANSVDFLNAADMFQLKPTPAGYNIKAVALEFIAKNFHHVVKDKSNFAKLSSESLLQLLEARVDEGKSNVSFGPEIDLFRTVLCWRQVQSEEIKATLDERWLKVIRFPLMTPSDLDEVETLAERASLNSSLLSALLEEARTYHALPMHHQVRSAFSNPKIITRNAPCVVSLAEDQSQNLSFFILAPRKRRQGPHMKYKMGTWLRIPLFDKHIPADVHGKFKFNYCIAVRGFLIIGGYKISIRQQHLYIVDLRTGHWAPMPAMNVPRRSFPLVECEDKIYSLGGVELNPQQSLSDVIERYSFDEDRWEVVGSMGKLLRGHGGCSRNGAIFVHGGRGEGGRKSSVLFKYTPSTGKWSKLHGGLGNRVPVDSTKMDLFNNNIITACPFNGNVASFGFKTGKWQRLSYMAKDEQLVPCKNSDAVVLDDSVFFLQGVRISSDVGKSCTQVTNIIGGFGHAIAHPDIPQGWTLHASAALAIPWDVTHHATLV